MSQELECAECGDTFTASEELCGECLEKHGEYPGDAAPPPLRWSRTPPSSPGWWWTREGEEVVVAKIFSRPSGGLQISAANWFEPLWLTAEFEPNREWAGPIAPPREG